MTEQSNAGLSDPEFPLPDILTYPSSTPPILVTQGAEGRLYKTTYLLPDQPCALKYRPPKAYRHPLLDQRLTRQRILAEARILAKCRREGMLVPALYFVDETKGVLMMEWVAGGPVRAKLNDWLKSYTGDVENNPDVVALMRKVGTAVGKMHKAGVIHGDLTTSNMMLRPRGETKHNQQTGDSQVLDGEVVVIDFGLALQGVQDEDRAVDLYVLERAFGSTHPRAEVVFPEVLQAYKGAYKQAGLALKKLEDVRMRGRKRSMLG